MFTRNHGGQSLWLANIMFADAFAGMQTDNDLGNEIPASGCALCF